MRATRTLPLFALLLLGLLLGGGVSVSGCLSGCGSSEEPLPRMMEIGDFALVDQREQAFGSQQLRGKVYIADFIFTSCPSICPMLSSQMANLHRRLNEERLRFVSITVDPETDTPQVLRRYAARYGADQRRWLFLTGEPEAVRGVVVRNFRMPVSDRIPVENDPEQRYDIEHGARFMLIDRQGWLRALYGSDRAELDRLERDARRLLRE